MSDPRICPPSPHLVDRTLRQRLRPFVGRDLRTRLLTSLGTVMVVLSLAWLGVSVLAGLDSREAMTARVRLGIENPARLCGGHRGPACTFDDREQARIDREFRRAQTVRLAVTAELQGRIGSALEQLDAVEAQLPELELDPHTGRLIGDLDGLRSRMARATVDLRPLVVPPTDQQYEELAAPLYARARRAPGQGRAVPSEADTASEPRDELRRAIELHRLRLEAKAELLAAAAAREGDAAHRPTAAQTSRARLVSGLRAAADDARDASDAITLRTLAGWLGPLNESSPRSNRGVSWTLATLVESDPALLTAAIGDPDHPLWHGSLRGYPLAPIQKLAVRYRSQVQSATRARLAGIMLLAIGGLLLCVVAPVVTATGTAREREAGTLPVLRMTGLSAGDLAAAMMVGPNLATLASGAVLLGLSLVLLVPTVGLTAAGFGLVVVGLSLATNVVAIGLGDALGTRVNAMVVGGLMALGLVVPGLLGAVAALGGLGTGLLLGPLPLLVAGVTELSDVVLPFASALEHDLGRTMALYGAGGLALMAGICRRSWTRRVEEGWAPLFRPAEGALLALMSVGATALTVLDLSERLGARSFDDVNLVTFVSTGFLLPVVGWLLVASLRRPARAAAVASHHETRRAFCRFQLIVMATVVGVGAAYLLAVRMAGLPTAEAELMWATLAQTFLFAQTAVATLLWMSRRRSGRARIGALGSLVLGLQAVAIAVVYRLEVDHVALHHRAGKPLLVGMDASPYWMLFLALLWGTALGLVLAALLRERDRTEAMQEAKRWEEEEDDDDDEKPRRWLH